MTQEIFRKRYAIPYANFKHSLDESNRDYQTQRTSLLKQMKLIYIGMNVHDLLSFMNDNVIEATEERSNTLSSEMILQWGKWGHKHHMMQ